MEEVLRKPKSRAKKAEDKWKRSKTGELFSNQRPNWMFRYHSSLVPLFEENMVELL